MGPCPTFPEEGSGQMVRSVADRAFLPTKNLLEEVGDMMILTGKTIVSALRPPYPYGGEFVMRGFHLVQRGLAILRLSSRICPGFAVVLDQLGFLSVRYQPQLLVLRLLHQIKLPGIPLYRPRNMRYQVSDGIIITLRLVIKRLLRNLAERQLKIIPRMVKIRQRSLPINNLSSNFVHLLASFSET